MERINWKNYSKLSKGAKTQALNELGRRCKEKTQKMVAKDLGISQAYLSDVLNNRRGMADKLMKQLLG